jgi:hypothetical protein
MNDRGKLHRKVGCEWTWQTADRRTCVSWEQVQQVQGYLDRNRVKHYKPPATDDYCLEIPTPPCKTLLELKGYWEAQAGEEVAGGATPLRERRSVLQGAGEGTQVALGALRTLSPQPESALPSRDDELNRSTEHGQTGIRTSYCRSNCQRTD